MERRVCLHARGLWWAPVVVFAAFLMSCEPEPNGKCQDSADCPSGMTCDAGVCRSICVPSCTGLCCGDDGCGGTCDDTCGDTGQACSASTCRCEGTCRPLTCQGAGVECGQASDGCEGTLSCGTCPSGDTCNSSGQCVSICVPQTCEQQGRQCGSVDDGCGTTLNCGGCQDGFTCMLGVCTVSQSNAPVLSLASQDGQDFTLRWTYQWGGVVTSQDYYELQESTGGGFTRALTTAPGDHSSPYEVEQTRSSGSYSFRARAFRGMMPSWSDFSNVVTVQVTQSCVPSCNGKECGPDGCGGSCGPCPPNSACSPDQQYCPCNAGYVPDPSFTSCIRLDGQCPSGVDGFGYCSGDLWIWCDSQRGVVSADCRALGLNGCVTTQGVGACACSGVDSVVGACIGFAEPYNEIHLACLDPYGILTARNCRDGGSRGFCGTYFTGGGYQGGCFCDNCVFLNRSSNSCDPLCFAGGTCVTLSGGAMTCQYP